MSVSQSSQHLPSLDQDQVYIDALVESTIVQSFLTGVYALIFFQAVASPSRHKNRTIIVILSVLFITVMVNLMAVWQFLRLVVVYNDATRYTMVQEIFIVSPSNIQKGVATTLAFAAIVSDALLAWRCYILWERNKWMLVGYSIVLFGELAVLPFFLAFNVTMGPHWSYLDIYFVISLCITITTTVLIIYRIVNVTKGGNSTLNRYHYTIKILAESGILYATVILLCGLLLVIQISGVYNASLIRATLDLNAILVPVTGIAPTLISARNAKAHDTEDFQAPSRIEFKEASSEAGAIPFIGNDLQDTSSVENWQTRSL